MKKNTLLTLDEELVELAKKNGLNISQLANNALKNELLNDLSGGSMIKIYEQLQENETIHLLNNVIKEIELTNVGPIGHFRGEFIDGLNTIQGGNATGKTAIVTTIVQGLVNPAMNNEYYNDDSDVIIRFESGSELELNQENEFKDVKSIIIDDLGMLTLEVKNDFIEYLKKKYNNPQIIVTKVPNIAITSLNEKIRNISVEYERILNELEIHEEMEIREKRINDDINTEESLKINKIKDKLEKLNELKHELNTQLNELSKLRIIHG